ncbi:MAG: ferritin [Verrucomicrobia bacterium]|nr:MAG: ferritin [Verrucomicrobiota bacterium]
MNIPSKTQKLLNEQFYNELYAAHIYFAMSAYFRHTPFQGMAKWMHLQSKEEIGHAMKIYEYLIERGSKFVPGTVEKPAKSDFSSPLEAFRTAYEHEKLVTSQLTKIYETANEESDWVSADFLSWFLKEQVEEEQSTFAFVRGLEYAGDDKNLLIGVDSWAGKRAE